MITNTQILRQLLTPLKSSFFPSDSDPSEYLFFDIETTGLSPRTSRTFLIGIIQQTGNTSAFELTQLMAQRNEDTEEKAILQAFSDLISAKKYLIHFNGTSFDVPYLMHRYTALGMSHPFSHIIQIDLYRELLRMPCFFRQMPDHRQKTFETLVSYERKDKLSGKEMIKIYQNYVKSQNSEALQLLLLHNFHDLEGMTAIIKLGSLKQLLCQKYEVKEVKEITQLSLDHRENRNLLFSLSLHHSVPAHLSACISFCYITIQNNTAKIKMPLFEGTLKHYYPDYKNYYYLPYEDEAVHKSIAIYTDSSRRQKASASNCYKRVSGTFVYAPGNPPLPLLKEERNSKEQYVQWPFSDSSPDILKSYLHEILKTAITEK